MTVTALPTPPTQADPANFATRMDAYLSALVSPFVSQVNTTEANIQADAAAALVASDSAAAAGAAITTEATNVTAAAAFAGRWTALAGAKAPPLSVYHGDRFWYLNTATADVTLDVPGVSAKWSALPTLRMYSLSESLPSALEPIACTWLGGTNIRVADGISAGGERSVSFGQSLFVASNYTSNASNVASSPDGITWTLRAMTASAQWVHSFGNGVFLAVAVSGTTVNTSSNGTTWAAATALPAASRNTFHRPAYSSVAGAWLVASNTATTAYRSVDNGVNWTTQTLPADPVQRSAFFILNNGNFFYANGSNGYVSSTGLTGSWSTNAIPISITSGGLHQDVDGTIYAQSGGAGYTTIYKTTDGVTWTRVDSFTPLASNHPFAAVYGKILQVGSRSSYNNLLTANDNSISFGNYNDFTNQVFVSATDGAGTVVVPAGNGVMARLSLSDGPFLLGKS